MTAPAGFQSGLSDDGLGRDTQFPRGGLYGGQNGGDKGGSLLNQRLRRFGPGLHRGGEG